MYKVVSIIMDGLDIMGFQLEEIDTKNSIRVKDNKMLDLIKAGKVEGVGITEDNGQEFVTGMRLSQLMVTSYNQIKLADKVYGDDGKVTGYTVADSDKSISSNQAWKMAAHGKIENGVASFVTDDKGNVIKYFQFYE